MDRAPTGSRARSARCVAAAHGHGPRHVRGDPRRPVRGIPRPGRGCGVHRCVGRRVLRSRGHPSIPERDRRDGRVGRRVDAGGHRPVAAGRPPAAGRGHAAEAGLDGVGAPWACPGRPTGADLRGPVRVRRSDLPARHGRPARFPHRPRGPARTAHLRGIGRVAGRRPARDLDARDPGDGGRLARCSVAVGHRSHRQVIGDHRGARRPRRRRSRSSACSSRCSWRTCSAGSTRWRPRG